MFQNALALIPRPSEKIGVFDFVDDGTVINECLDRTVIIALDGKGGLPVDAAVEDVVVLPSNERNLPNWHDLSILFWIN